MLNKNCVTQHSVVLQNDCQYWTYFYSERRLSSSGVEISRLSLSYSFHLMGGKAVRFEPLKTSKLTLLQNFKLFYFQWYNDNSKYFEIYEIRSKTFVSARFSVSASVSKWRLFDYLKKCTTENFQTILFSIVQRQFKIFWNLRDPL